MILGLLDKLRETLNFLFVSEVVTTPLGVPLPFSEFCSSAIPSLCFFFNYFLYLVVNKMVLTFYFLMVSTILIFIPIFFILLLIIYFITQKTNVDKNKESDKKKEPSKKKVPKHSPFKSYSERVLIIILVLLFALGLSFLITYYLILYYHCSADMTLVFQSVNQAIAVDQIKDLKDLTAFLESNYGKLEVSLFKESIHFYNLCEFLKLSPEKYLPLEHSKINEFPKIIDFYTNNIR